MTAQLKMLQALAASINKDGLSNDGLARYRVLAGVQGPYLERWLLHERPDGGHVYLHHFLRSDEDQELHCHPWFADSLILSGECYEERRSVRYPSSFYVSCRRLLTGMVNTIEPNTYHRIELATPDMWTLFNTGPKQQSWGFWNRDTDVETPWREFLAAKGALP